MLRRRRALGLQGGGAHDGHEGDELHDRLPQGHERREDDEDLQLVGQEVALRPDGHELGGEAEVNGGGYETPRRLPTGPPMAALPPLPAYQVQVPETPSLFTPAQLEEMEQPQRRAPMLQATRLEQKEDQRDIIAAPMTDGNIGKGRGDPFGHMRGPKVQQFQMGTQPHSENEAFADDMVWKWRMQQEMKELGLQLRASQAENHQLRTEIADMKGEGRFHTPDSHELPGAAPHHRRPQGKPGRPADGGAGGRAGGGGTTTPVSAEDQRLHITTLMLKGMQDLHQKMNEKEGGGSDGGVEVVRNGIQDLPSLAEWEPTEAPFRMGDWLALLEPIMADLSTTSDMWWRTMVEEMTNWYQIHIKMPPLARRLMSRSRRMS